MTTATTPHTGDPDATALVRRTMPLCETLGVVGHEFGRDRVVHGLAWRPELCTSNGLLHGGAVMALADSAGAGCAFANLPDGAVGTSTIESKTNFLGAVTSGGVTATATVLHRGSTTIVVETEVRDDAGKLVAKVTDDGIPKRGQGGVPTVQRPRASITAPAAPRVNPVYVPPARPVPGKFNALYVAWFVYRGSGEVSFDPEQVVVWEDSRTGANSPWAPLWQPPTGEPDGTWTARATFSRPGSYILRAHADDGALYADQDVTVTVVP